MLEKYFNPMIPPSRAALKLASGIDQFSIDLSGLTCADFGANSGGFTAVMLNSGAVKVYAVETGYGVLDWKLRNDERVIVMERTNAMHVILPEKVDFISIDTSWTKQIHILNSALNNLKSDGRILTLVKPHYEAEAKHIKKGQLNQEYLPEILHKVEKDIESLNITILKKSESPLEGKSAKNKEWLYFLKVNNL